MTNLFSGLEPQSGPFDNVPVEDTALEAPARPQARFRRAQVVAAARVDPASPTIFEDYQKLMDSYQRTAELYGDSQDDIAVAEQRRDRRVRNVLDVVREAPQIDPTGELQMGAQMAAQSAINADIEQERKYALEQQAVDNILDLAASGNRTQAEALINLMETGDVVDQMRDMAAKQLILQNEIDKASFEASAQPWYRHAANFGLDVFTSFLNPTSQVGIVDVGRNVSLGDRFMAGERRREEAANLWQRSQQMSIEDFRDYVKEEVLPNIDSKSTLLGYTNLSERLDLLTGLQQTPRPADNNFWNTLDTAGYVGAGEILGATKFATSLPRMLTGLGARKEGAGALANAAAKLAAEGTEEAVQRAGLTSINEVTDSLTPSIARPDGGDMAVPVSTSANDALARGLQLIEERLPQLIQTGRFADTAEMNKAIEEFTKQSADAFGNAVILDVKESTRSLADSSRITRLTFTLGKTADEGWSKPRFAERFKNSLGFTDSEVVQGEGGQYFVNVTRNMPETAFWSNNLNVKTKNIMSRFLLGARQRSDEFLANRAQVSENTRNKIVNDWRNKMFKEIKIDPASTERVAQLWQLGENQGRWFTDLNEVNALYRRAFSRDITPKEWKAYNGMRDINDVEYAMRNDTRYKELAVKGYESASFNVRGQSFTSINSIFDDSFSRPVRLRAFNEKTGGYTSKTPTPEEVEQLKAEGYVMIHFDEPLELADGKEIMSAIVRKDTTVRDTLERTQLAYRPGGHRIYQERYFVKQGRMVMDEDGNEVWKNPQTFIVGTKAQVDEWADTMERARLLGPNASLAQLDEVFQGRAGYPTPEQFKAGLEDGTYNADLPFTSLFDRELPAAYDKLDSTRHAFDPDEDASIGFLKTHGRLYYSQKNTNALRDWQGEQAPTLDPYQTINRAFTNIANLSSFSDYKLTSIHRWVKTFRGYLDESSVRAGASDVEIFMNAKPKPGASRDRIENALEDQRAIIKRNLGWKTEQDLKLDEVQRNFFEFVQGSDPSSLRHGASRVVQNWWEQSNPIQFLRGAAFDLKLGLFNPSQLLLQANTYLAIAAIDPMGAGKALGTIGPLRAFLTRWADNGLLDHLITSNAHKLAGFDDPEEYKAFMMGAKQSGFFSLNESHSLINAMGPSTVLNLTGSKTQNIREAGRFFFNEGEIFNRMTAFRVAWDRVKTKMGDNIDNTRGEDFLNQVFGEAETLAFSMSRPSQAAWQQGLASLPTQFFAYQARMLEMMFGGQLSRNEKIRLFITQGLLYGASGIPFASVVTDMMKAKEGDAAGLDTLQGIMSRGAIDYLINATTGADVLAGERLGTGRFIGDTVGDLFGYSKYGETNTMDILGGATYSITSDLFETFKPFLKYTAAESGGDIGAQLTERDFLNLANNISTVSNTLKAMLIWNHGIASTNKGRYQADEVPKENAFWQMFLGAQSSEIDTISARMAYMKDKKKVVDEAAKVIEQYRVEIVNHPERADEIAAQINIFTTRLDPEVRREALTNARTPDKSLLDGLDERYERMIAERDAIKRLEEEGAQ